MIRAALLEVYN